MPGANGWWRNTTDADDFAITPELLESLNRSIRDVANGLGVRQEQDQTEFRWQNTYSPITLTPDQMVRTYDYFETSPSDTPQIEQTPMEKRISNLGKKPSWYVK